MSSDTWKDAHLHTAYAELGNILDDLDELIEWAENEGFTAIQHKLEEATNPLSSAMSAANQYDDGTLERR